MKSFENFLIDVHADQYQGLDDDMPDDYDRFIENLDMDTVFSLAERYGNELATEITRLKGVIAQMYEDCEECEYKWGPKPKE